MEQTDANLRAIGTQRTGINPKIDSAKQMDANPRVVSAKQTGANPWAEIARSNSQSLVGTGEHIEDLLTTKKILTIIEGPKKDWGQS